MFTPETRMAPVFLLQAMFFPRCCGVPVHAYRRYGAPVMLRHQWRFEQDNALASLSRGRVQRSGRQPELFSMITKDRLLPIPSVCPREAKANTRHKELVSAPGIFLVLLFPVNAIE